MACSAMAFFASGIFFRGFTVFVPAVRDSLGLSQAQTNLVFSVARAEGGLEGPVAGWAIDRFGNRALLVPGIILAAIGYFVFAGFVHSYLTFALVYLGMISLGNSIAFQHALFAFTDHENVCSGGQVILYIVAQIWPSQNHYTIP